jgi:hypothetical protein
MGILRTLHSASVAKCPSTPLQRLTVMTAITSFKSTYIILPSTGTISSATMLMILMRGLMAGPAVSL